VIRLNHVEHDRSGYIDRNRGSSDAVGKPGAPVSTHPANGRPLLAGFCLMHGYWRIPTFLLRKSYERSWSHTHRLTN